MSSEAGKGDKRRPGKGYADGFDRIFRSTKPEENKDDGDYWVVHCKDCTCHMCREARRKPVPLTPDERLKKQYDETIRDFDKKHKL